jgi:hypothetical protein
MPATYEPIATTTLSSAASSITFSSISSAYTDLRVVLVGTSASNTQDVYVQFNGSSSYGRTWISGNGTSATSGRSTTQSYWTITQNAFTSSTVPTMHTVDIFSYAGSTYKTGLSTSSSDLNGSGGVDRSVGLWLNTAAITSVLLKPSAGNWNSGTTATLYGIKAA